MSGKRVRTYPLAAGEAFPAPSLLRRCNAVLQTLREIGAARSTPSVIIRSNKPHRPLSQSDVPLIVLTHNDARLIPSFLEHYRKLGVTRFIVMDDISSDATIELLVREKDVDLHTSNIRYKEAKRGRHWRMALVERYGLGRWYLNTDSDEFLVYRDFENKPLLELISALNRRRIRHFPAPMLDMYPPGSVATASYSGERMPWEIASHFDTAGYSVRASTVNWRVEGGVRQRVFRSSPQLMKYPLMRWDRLTGLDRNIHSPAPYWRNFGPPLGVLLHFKFFSDFDERFRKVVENGQHYRSSAYYNEIISQIADPSDLILEDDVSAFYSGSEDLHRRGFIADWQTN